MSTGLSSDSLLMNNDETLWVVRSNQDVGTGVVYVDGKAVRNPSTMTIFACAGNVQPVDGADLLRYAEGDQTDDQFWVWSNQHQKAVTAGDITTRDGTHYQCQQTEPWGNYTRSRWVADQTLVPIDDA